MRHELLTDKELAELVKERAESQNWIVIQGNSSESFMKFCTLIENRFYEPGTSANRGFQVVLPVCVAFLRKKELSEDVIEFFEEQRSEKK